MEEIGNRFWDAESFQDGGEDVAADVVVGTFPVNEYQVEGLTSMFGLNHGAQQGVDVVLSGEVGYTCPLGGEVHQLVLGEVVDEAGVKAQAQDFCEEGTHKDEPVERFWRCPVGGALLGRDWFA